MLFGFDTKKKKILTMLTLIMFMGSSFFAGAVIATVPSTWADVPTYIGPGSMVSEAEYIVFIDSSGAICAKNGYTGVIELRSGDAYTVIQYAINNTGLSNGNEHGDGGGEVYIKAGDYTLTAGLLIKNKARLTLNGEYGAQLILGANVDNNVIELDTSVMIQINGFVINGNAGNNSAGNGLYIHDFIDVRISDIRIYNVVEHGLYTYNSGLGANVFIAERV
jgi:hypothetical protein